MYPQLSRVPLGSGAQLERPAFMVDLPSEVWAYIARFIPDHDLRNLFGVNRTFFDIAIDLRYREVCFNYLNNDNRRNFARIQSVYLLGLITKSINHFTAIGIHSLLSGFTPYISHPMFYKNNRNPSVKFSHLLKLYCCVESHALWSLLSGTLNTWLRRRDTPSA